MSKDLDSELASMMARAAVDVEGHSGIDPTVALRRGQTALRRRRTGLGIVSMLGAAAILASALLVLGQPSPAPGPATPPDQASPDSVLPAPTVTLPVYYLGETPQGPRLYREFHPVQTADPLSAAVDLAVSQPPKDPDYRNPWAAGVRATAQYNGDVLTVDLADDSAQGLHDRPTGRPEAEITMALEQVIYTAQAALGKGRVPVQFLLDGQRTDQVLGQPASEPLSNGPVLETLSLVNITTPSDGDQVAGSLEVTGVSNSFEANVIVDLQRYEGTEVVLREGVTAEGWMENKLFAFSKTFDISDVEPGKYVLTAMTDDPSGGEEGFGPFSDSKVITIE